MQKMDMDQNGAGRENQQRKKVKQLILNGDISYGVITSTNKSAYPSNGKSGSYWYVYKGLQ